MATGATSCSRCWSGWRSRRALQPVEGPDERSVARAPRHRDRVPKWAAGLRNAHDDDVVDGRGGDADRRIAQGDARHAVGTMPRQASPGRCAGTSRRRGTCHPPAPARPSSPRRHRPRRSARRRAGRRRGARPGAGPRVAAEAHGHHVRGPAADRPSTPHVVHEDVLAADERRQDLRGRRVSGSTGPAQHAEQRQDGDSRHATVPARRDGDVGGRREGSGGLRGVDVGPHTAAAEHDREQAPASTPPPRRPRDRDVAASAPP